MSFLMDYVLRIPIPLVIILCVIFLVSGDFFGRYWSIHNQSLYIILTVVSYGIFGIFFIPLLAKEGLIASSLIVIVLNLILDVILGVTIFKESLNIYRTLGLFLGLMAVVLMEL